MSDTRRNHIFLESSEVTEVVGVSLIQLNKMIERGQYGIAPSFRSGKGRGSRRLFSEDDVYGIALVWWLFEAGLRSQTIQYVLNVICRFKGANANDAARILMKKEKEEGMLVITREPRTVAGKESRPKQDVSLVDWTAATHFVESTETASVLFIPVLDRFVRLREKMQSAQLGDKPQRSE